MDFANKSLIALAVGIAVSGLLIARPAAAQSAPTTIATYTYNAKGERITKTVDGVTTRFIYDEAGHLISERSPNGDRDYIYLGDMLVSTVDTPAKPAAAPSTVSYVVADHTGNPRAVTNSAGTVIWQNPYQGNAWGEQPVTSNGYTLNLRAVGQYYDEETGHIYNGQRYYDPNSGRFDQPDPLGVAGGIGLYVAVSNNPLNRVDPDGLRDIFVGGLGDSSTGLVQNYYNKYHQSHPDSAYYEWNQQAAILADVNSTAPGDPVNLIGHSYGGDTAAAVSEKACRKVNLLITIDPVSRFHYRGMQNVENSANTWVDVDAEGGSPFAFDNMVAGVGGAWDDDPSGIADSYIQANTSHADFTGMMNASAPGVNSPAQVLAGAPTVTAPFVSGRGGN